MTVPDYSVGPSCALEQRLYHGLRGVQLASPGFHKDWEISTQRLPRTGDGFANVLKGENMISTRRVLLVASAFAVLVGWSLVSAAPTPPPPVAPTTAAESSDKMDSRRPVPLLPMMANHQKQNMRDHLLAVQEIVAALATDDYPAIARAAGRIGFSEQMGQMCTDMGAGAPYMPSGSRRRISSTTCFARMSHAEDVGGGGRNVISWIAKSPGERREIAGLIEDPSQAAIQLLARRS